jgi:hypothetical protein
LRAHSKLAFSVNGVAALTERGAVR